MPDSLCVHASSPLSRTPWTATMLGILNQSGTTVEEGEWLMTDSATGTFVPLHGEGSKVVAAVSSEMAIPYSVNAGQRKTMVTKAAPESIACHSNCIGFAGARLAG